MTTYESKEERFSGQDDEGRPYKINKEKTEVKPFTTWPKLRGAVEELKSKNPPKKEKE